MEEAIRALSVPIIVSIVYGFISFYKQITGNKEVYLRFIPIVAAIAGTIVGIIAYFGFPNIIIAQNIWQAIIIGGASGLTATGTNQIFKQIGKGEIINNDSEEDDSE